MKVNDPNLSSLAQSEALKGSSSSAASKVKQDQLTSTPLQGEGVQTSKTQLAGRIGSGIATETGAPDGASRDDVHLSELVRSLRSLAADSPERAQRLEQIARAYSNGTYQVDTQRTAQGIIDDALRST